MILDPDHIVIGQEIAIGVLAHRERIGGKVGRWVEHELEADRWSAALFSDLCANGGEVAARAGAAKSQSRKICVARALYEMGMIAGRPLPAFAGRWRATMAKEREMVNWGAMARKLWAQGRFWLLGAVVAILVLGWALAPAARGYEMLANSSNRAAPSDRAAGIPVKDVTFDATDGVKLSGWLAVAAPESPTIILVHGFKSTRVSMVPWARYLYGAGYNVLLYDSRGCGASAGWGIGLGATEPNDIIGAVHFLQGYSGLTSKKFGVLGVSLGAGDAILAAAREKALLAVVADSPWADEQPQIARMGSVSRGPLTIPLLPYEPALINTLVGANLGDVSPAKAAEQIGPRALFIITSADDANTTTKPTDQARVYAAAAQPKQQWTVPRGGHVGALFTDPTDYEQRTLSFFAQYVGLPGNAVQAGA
jgi:cephalosporin-C deacetylase-like acetyl esterase